MELEATILERLEELRRWQVEQQERLIQQQHEQRERLTYEQDRMYEALGLSVQGIVLDDSVIEKISSSPNSNRNIDNDRESSINEFHRDNSKSEDSISLCNDNNKENQPQIALNVPPLQLNTNRHLNYKLPIDGFSPRSEIPLDHEQSIMTLYSEHSPVKNNEKFLELSMEGVEPFSIDKVSVVKRIAIDDLPVPSPKKDFTTLLEERLRDCEMDDKPSQQNIKTMIKRPFLKKGEGLARFKPNVGGNLSKERIRQRSASLSANMYLSSSSAKTKNTPRSSRAGTKNSLIPPVAQIKLNLKNIPPPKKKPRSKSLSAVPINRSLNNVKAPVDMNTSSDCESKQRRELEEMRIFELLEEKAENSSFCSNSSTVLALFRQSTPLKHKNTLNNHQDPRQRLMKDSIKHESSDTSLEEIVRTTKTNKTVPGSPVTKIRETVIQKDIVFSKWDSGPFNDDNNDGNSSFNNRKRGLERAITSGSFKTTQHTKHTTIQFNNNNNIVNNNSRKPVVHSDDEDVCDVSGVDNIDVPYDINCSDAIERKINGDDSLADDEGPNVSLHVRFSEYNEYKTIGLTDTSMMSNDTNQTRSCMKDKAWSDRSTSPESSDVEVLFSKGTTRPGNVSPQQKKDSRGYESTDQTTDDEQYTSNCSSDTSYEDDNTLAETSIIKPRESDDESDLCNDSGSTIRQENNEVASNLNGIDSVDVNGTIFKSELLKTRLLELEREIEIFRKENAALANQRKKLNEEQRQREKESKQREENLEKERKCAEDIMQEEKKRLAREKSALENRLRDAREKSLQNKQERLETQTLREQLDELREDASQKESRWQAAQARQKSQIRVLQTENAKLKQELEKLKQLRGNSLRPRRIPAPSNTKIIHQINKQLQINGKKKISPKKDSSSDEEETLRQQIIYKDYQVEEIENNSPNSAHFTTEVDNDGSKMIVYNMNDDDIRKKRNMYTDLLNEATEGLRGREELIIGKTAKSQQKTVNQPLNRNDKDTFESNSSDSFGHRNLDKSLKDSYEKTLENFKINDDNIERRSGELLNNSKLVTNSRIELKRTPERLANSSNQDAENNSAKKQDIREVLCPDGHTEYWYPNGNVKKIFPDRNVTKMVYYNGDVRENTEDGSVKYFYASTRTWHTTLPDGLEILEFPDGQVERRTKNGTIEVSFPDGSVRLLEADGTEKWVLPDGTIAETFPDGDKVLSFPNGQREIHTKEHKRREYPDGTIKLVYPDGTQETRYSTGRVRVKDKDGNLIMDVHHR